MTAHFGIDTSILVRLTTGEPQEAFDEAVAALTEMVEREHASVFASNMVIGEAYIALQHHYGVAKADAKSALRSVLTSGLIAPVGGESVLEALATTRGCGLLDRLIALRYTESGLTTLTLDRKMATLPNVRRLGSKAQRK